MYACKYVCMYVCTYVCMHVCMFVYLCVSKYYCCFKVLLFLNTRIKSLIY